MATIAAATMHKIDEYDAIVSVCELYMTGAANGDRQKLKLAFHSDARTFGSAGGRRLDGPVDQFIEIACADPVGRGGTYRGRVLEVNQVGDAASAVISEDGCWGSVSFIDYMSLARIDGTWKIVGKTFAHTGGEMPG